MVLSSGATAGKQQIRDHQIKDYGANALIQQVTTHQVDLPTGNTLLLHFNGANNGTSFVEESGRGVTAYGDAVTSTTVAAKFGSASGRFHGREQDSNNSIVVSTSQTLVTFGTGDFTIECFAYINAHTTTQSYGLFSTRNSSTRCPVLVTITPEASGLFTVTVNGSATGVSFNYVIAATNSMAPATWTHIAVVNRSNVLSLYVGGTRWGTANTASGFMAAATGLRIGTDWAPGASAAGSNYLYIDEFRLVKGTAMYSGASLTVPAAPFSL